MKLTANTCYLIGIKYLRVTMNDETIKHYFEIIDAAIKVFNADKNIKIDSSEHGDWIVFDQRSLEWSKNGLEYLLQVYPNSDDQEQLTSWTLYGAVYYDTETDRYLSSFNPASEVSLDYIALNTEILLNETYNYISSIKKEDIPHAV
jgi:hypothetical protein